MLDVKLLQDLLVVFGLGVTMVFVFHRLNMPSVLGFLITGVLCGPFGFKLVEELHAIEALAEIGLVVLLFEAGIEFSIKTFMRLKRFLLIAGTLQIVLTIAATAGIAYYFGQDLRASIFLGMLVSLSSTALVIRVLEYRGDLDATHGRAAMSILIFQDLCIVPMVLVVPYLAGQGGSVTDILLLTGKALLFVVVAGMIARYLIPYLLSHVARIKRREAFVLSIIFLCLGTAFATSHFGLSMALGAFIAGLVISDSKYSHQALSEVLPIREILNCLVFVSIGMIFDVRVLLANPSAVIMLLVAIMVVKTITGFVATAATGYSWRISLLTGVVLAQASEFSFVLSKLGYASGILDERTNQLFLAAAILSMFATPSAISVGHFIQGKLKGVIPDGWGQGLSKDKDQEAAAKAVAKAINHVIVVGFGVAGQSIVQALTAQKLPFVVVEFDPIVVKEQLKRGLPIMYGDASRLEVLQHVGLARARSVVLTMSDSTIALAACDLVARQNPSAHLAVRARYLRQVRPLKSLGANRVIPEEAAGAIELTKEVLNNYALPQAEVDVALAALREDLIERASR